IDLEVMPCISSPKPLAYRNKIQLPVSQNLRLGLYAHNSHDLVEIEKCDIHSELGEKTLAQIQRLLKTAPEGKKIKHVLIKTAVNTQQVLVILVTNTHELLTCLGEKILQSMPEIKGVVQNIHPDESNVVLGTRFQTLAGLGAIEEKLSGFTFKVSPASFFQVNPEQAEALYQKVVELARLTGQERVLDAYCGVGTLSLILAKHAKEVIGIESSQSAIGDANENAATNQIFNAQFICGLAEEKIRKLEEVDVAVLNPPRGGCEASFLEALAQLKPKRILYVSCDPATLARDLQMLKQKGYTVDHVQPFDMFPQTMHVESVALLERIL
ncbi:MAG: 23S rRNA (uracil(1939)-C(5))-methyltransferase RlmD, partial [Chlamydiales bacterium]